MKRHLNTLFVTTQGAYLAREGEAVLVRVEKETRLRVPVHTIGSVVCFGRVGFSPALLGLCGERGVAVSFLSMNGRFLARASGFTFGNVLLRREQYRRADDADASAALARAFIAAKLANARSVLLRHLRDSTDDADVQLVEKAAARLAACAHDASIATTVDAARGQEGEAGAAYFGVFDSLLRGKDAFRFHGRVRRPPTDPVNALLSFLYALLSADCRAACEAAGLDPQVGFLHRDRPGRPSLALDLMEELRPVLADRLVLSLINRRQLRPDGFTTAVNGAVRMDDATRKAVLTAYQKRKQQELTHPLLGERVSLGLVPHLQARVLARHLRGESDAYVPFLWK